MTPEERSMLNETYELTAENNKILKSIRTMNRVSTALRVFYWIVILLVSFGAYYFIQPYINALGDAYGALQGDLNKVNQITDTLGNLKNDLGN